MCIVIFALPCHSTVNIFDITTRGFTKKRNDNNRVYKISHDLSYSSKKGSFYLFRYLAASGGNYSFSNLSIASRNYSFSLVMTYNPQLFNIFYTGNKFFPASGYVYFERKVNIQVHTHSRVAFFFFFCIKLTKDLR